MYSFLRRTTLVTALFVSVGGFTGCSSDEGGRSPMPRRPTPTTGGKMEDAKGKWTTPRAR